MKKKSQTQTSVKAGKPKAKKDSKMPAVLELPETYSTEESNHPSHLRRGAVEVTKIRPEEGGSSFSMAAFVSFILSVMGNLCATFGRLCYQNATA